jgi:hypothetical protein
MSEDTITIQYSLSKEDLICCVCLEELTCPIIQCANGNHFVCVKCYRQVQRSCPVCRTGKLFRNKFLEIKLEPSMITCSNETCKKRLLPWSQEKHLAVCKHTEVECFLSDSRISLDSLIEHIKTECDIEWLERDGDATSGSVAMVMHQLDSGNLFTIKLPDTKANVTIISQQLVLLLKWNDDVGYHIALVESEQNSARMDAHFRIKPNPHSSIHSRMSLIGANTLAEVESFEKHASLPIDVQEIFINRNAAHEK